MSSAGLGKSKAKFERATPILRVADLSKSVEHYVRVLGFELNFQGPYFAGISRDQGEIYLSVGDQGHRGTWVWIGVEDVDTLLDEYRKSGAKIRHQPTNYSWAYEMQVEDLDGNVLRIGSEPKENEPTGEWLDMERQRWTEMPDGTWERAKES
jgi:catechol 2,3-dioxygenase-like lactoylglutathione lyase family enzyme